MRFSTRAKSNKSVNAKSRPEASAASTRSKITPNKKPHKKLPVGGEDTSEEADLPTSTIPSPRIKIKITRKINKKSKTRSVLSNTEPETSITSTKSKIVAKAHKKSLKGGEEAVTLRNSDVVLGRGNGIASWVGNKAFRNIVLSYKAIYKKAYRCEKSFVSRQVIEDVHKGGGRFVERDGSGGYVEVTYEKALEKTCQCLREKPIGESVAESVAEVDDECSEKIPAAEEEIPELSTSSSSAAKRK